MERTSRMDTSKYLGYFKKNSFSISIIFVSFLYLVLRIIFPETIEFGYDQPRLSNVVMDYLQNGSFMKLQYYSLPTAWENLSWGPSLVIFNSIFLYISNDPIVAAYLSIFFNMFSVIIILIICKEFFNIKIGLISAILLSAHPWWIIFSRMIYQPTPILTIVTLSMYFLFRVIKNNKSTLVLLLIITWGALLQMYLITFSFIFISGFLLALYTKLKLNYKYVGISIPILVLMYVPSFKYYFDNPQIFMKLFEFKGRYTTYFGEVFYSFVKNLSGLNFKWQLGYAYDSFLQTFPMYNAISFWALAFTILILIFGIFFTLKRRNKYEISIFLIMISPLWAIPLVGVEYVVPRYYLYILPSFVLLFAITILNLSKFLKITFLIPIFFVIFWTMFIYKYFIFIKSYNYPNGVLSLWSDPPYSYLDDSFKWIVDDAKSRSETFTVSSDLDYPRENRFNDAQTYYWSYVLKNKYMNEQTNNVGHYLMYYAPNRNIGVFTKQFGPYVVERLEGNPAEFINP